MTEERKIVNAKAVTTYLAVPVEAVYKRGGHRVMPSIKICETVLFFDREEIGYCLQPFQKRTY